MQSLLPRCSPRCKPAVCNFTRTIVVQHAQQTNVFVGNTLTDSQRESVFSGTTALVGVICRQLLSLQRISEVPCSFVGVTFEFLFVESRVFSSLLHAERLEHFIHALNILHNAILAANSKADIQRIDQRELCNTRRNEKLFRRIQFQGCGQRVYDQSDQG